MTSEAVLPEDAKARAILAGRLTGLSAQEPTAAPQPAAAQPAAALPAAPQPDASTLPITARTRITRAQASASC